MFSGYKAAQHPQQAAVDEINDRGTPRELFNALDSEFKFTLDVAASRHNHKCAEYFTKRDNGLQQSWAGHTVWCNPPYSSIRVWVEKAWEEIAGCVGIVMLLPANRCDQPWWHELVEPFRDQQHCALQTRFLKGRTKFVFPKEWGNRSNGSPPFGCLLLVFRPPMVNSPRPQLERVLFEDEAAR